MKKKHSQIFDANDLMLLLTQALLREIAPDLNVPRFTATLSVTYDQTPEGFIVRYNREGLLCEALVHAGELDVVKADIELWLAHPDSSTLLQRALLRRTQPELRLPEAREGAAALVLTYEEEATPAAIPVYEEATYSQPAVPGATDSPVVDDAPPADSRADAEAQKRNLRTWVGEYLGFYRSLTGEAREDAVRSVQLLADVLLAHTISLMLGIESNYGSNVPAGMGLSELKAFYVELLRHSTGALRGISLGDVVSVEELAAHVDTLYPGATEDSPLWNILDYANESGLTELREQDPQVQEAAPPPSAGMGAYDNGLPPGAYSNPKFQSVLADLQKRDREDENMSPTSFDPVGYAHAAENAAKKAKTRKRNAEIVEASLRKFPDIKDLIGSLPVQIIKKAT